MLKQLYIQNFAVIDELELLFKPGMTVFTGETGAGKSILVDALGLILGDRADASIIREDCEKTVISATLDIKNNSKVQTLVRDQALESEDNELLIRRVINKDGRSRAFVNNNPVTAQLLRLLGDHLVDIHGQHAHQSLTKRDTQRDLLDAYGRYEKELTTTGNAYHDWHDATQRLKTLCKNTDDHEATLSLLDYQIQELESLQIEKDEYETLGEEYKRLANINRLLETSQKALITLREGDHSVDTGLSNILSELLSLQQIDDSLTNITGLVETAYIQLQEASDELSMYVDGLNAEPEQLQHVEKRLSDLHDIARKHHIQPLQLTEHLHNLQQQLNELEGGQQSINELMEQQAQSAKQYDIASSILHQCRQKAARKMSTDITRTLKTLGMPNSKFNISIESDKDQQPKPHGSDQIEFLVSTNPGQPLQPLRKIVSGGELSRISLAIQVQNSSDKGIPTLVFDEVDAGIGGGTAEIVGQLLNKLSQNRQIFVVTHLAQVASQGKNHMQVHKSSNKTTTETSVNDLNAEERIEEIARMLGGIKISNQSRKHAKEMLELVMVHES